MRECTPEAFKRFGAPAVNGDTSIPAVIIIKVLFITIDTFWRRFDNTQYQNPGTFSEIHSHTGTQLVRLYAHRPITIYR